MQSFQERVDTLEEMLMVLRHCFGSRLLINLKEFTQITEEVSSDMALSVLSLMRERLPCSENYWRYRRNYMLHLENNGQQNVLRSQSMDKSRDDAPPLRTFAQSHLSFVKNLI